jgi:hypothetical protein
MGGRRWAAHRRRTGSHHRRCLSRWRALENRAIVEAHVEPSAEGGPGGIAVTAEIADYSTHGVPALGVTLRVDGAAVAQGVVELPAGGHARKRFLHSLPGDGSSSHDLVVEIDGDAFPLDDRRQMHVEMSRTLRILCVDGDPRAPSAMKTRPSSSRRPCATAFLAPW